MEAAPKRRSITRKVPIAHGLIAKSIDLACGICPKGVIKRDGPMARIGINLGDAREGD